MALSEIPVVYIVGSPRSGTTWLQRMLGGHPAIASPQETELLNGYIAPLLAEWSRQLPTSGSNWQRMRHKGLPAVLTETDFEADLARLVESVYRSILEQKPGATILLEKTLNYSLYLDVVTRLVPHARFIHILRDGRDVTASLVRASSGWGDWWAPRQTFDAATVWRQYVEAARCAVDAPGGYLELRYEDLLSERGPQLLRHALNFCGALTDETLASSLYEMQASGESSSPSGGIVWGGEVAARLGREPDEPDGFRGPGIAGNWRSALSPLDQRTVDYVVGDLLVALGYAADRRWPRGRQLPQGVVRAELRVSRAASGIRNRAVKPFLRSLPFHLPRRHPPRQ